MILTSDYESNPKATVSNGFVKLTSLKTQILKN